MPLYQAEATSTIRWLILADSQEEAHAKQTKLDHMEFNPDWGRERSIITMKELREVFEIPKDPDDDTAFLYRNISLPHPFYFGTSWISVGDYGSLPDDFKIHNSRGGIVQ